MKLLSILALGFLAPAFALNTGVSEEKVKLPPHYLPVPLVSQATDYSCGVAALLSVLYYWQVYDDSESSLYPALQVSPKDGTVPEKISEVAAAFGLKSEMREGLEIPDLEDALSAGKTVIVEMQAWRTEGAPELPWKDTWEEGHFAVVIGIDSKNIYFMDPVGHTGYAYLPRAEFMDRWHDYDVYNGVPKRHYQLGIIISGKKPLKRFPNQLVLIE